MKRYNLAWFLIGSTVFVAGGIGWAVTTGNTWAAFLFGVLFILNVFAIGSEFADIAAEHDPVLAVAKYLASEQGFEWGELDLTERARFIARAGGES